MNSNEYKNGSINGTLAFSRLARRIYAVKLLCTDDDRLKPAIRPTKVGDPGTLVTILNTVNVHDIVNQEPRTKYDDTQGNY